MPTSRRQGDYGYDAPYALIAFTALAVITAVLAALAWARIPAPAALMVSGYCLFFTGNAASFYYATRHGKFEEWERILNQLALTGSETVLDVGCGRGAVLTAVARRLTTGRVTGIDIWSVKDQSGNAQAVTLRNAELEGVSAKVQIDTGDMCQLPYADSSFDLIVSSLAIHNVPSAAARQRAIQEAFRVLKPGGRLAIADIRATTRYADTLRALGATNVTRRRLGWRLWWGNPIAATTLVTAAKPLR